jgi:heparan-alpha-glucosaminide N-acetyltransferase
MAWTEWTTTSFRGLNLMDLKVDEAFFNISNSMKTKFFLYSLSEECVKCPFKKLRAIPPNKETVIKLDTARSLELRLFDKDWGDYVFPNETYDGLRWSVMPELGEFGVYDLQIKETSVFKYECVKQPVNVQTCELTMINDSFNII